MTLAFHDGHVEFLKLKDRLGPGCSATNPKGMWTPNEQDGSPGREGMPVAKELPRMAPNSSSMTENLPSNSDNE